MQNRLALLITLLLISVTGCSGGGGGSGDSGSNGAGGARPPYPEVLPNGQINGEGNFAVLLKNFSEGKTRNSPWAGYWWPYSQNGIADSAQLYEQAHGGSGATSWELSHHGSGTPGLQSWFGHCNGWAAAAVLYQEPREAAAVGGVSFSVSDQKSILSEIGMEVNADFFGSRANADNTSSPEFQDVAPDVFFLVLTNYVGNGLPVVMDRYTGLQVWNHPIAGYQMDPVTASDYLGAHPSAANVYRVMVSTQVWWLRDDVDGGHLTEPFTFTDGPSYESRTLRYEVWLNAPLVFDSAGKITSSGTVIVSRQGSTAMGGAWRDAGLELVNSHPDYLWIPHRVSPSTGFTNPNLNVSWIESHFGRRNP